MTINKYEKVKDLILADIKNQVFTTALPCNRVLAEKYKVSKTSIDRAIAELRTSGIVETVSRVGSFILAEQKTPGYRISIILPTMPRLSRHGIILFAQTYDMIARELGSNYHVNYQEYSNAEGSERAALQRVLSQKVDGLYAVASLSDNGILINHDLYEQFRQKGVKIIFLYRNPTNFPASFFSYSQEGYVRAMVEKLESYRKPVNIVLMMQTHPYTKARRAHFDFLYGNKPGYHWVELPESDIDHLEESAEHIIAELEKTGISKSSQGVAIACVNDLYVYSAYQACAALGYSQPDIFSDGLLREFIFNHFSGAIDARLFSYARLSFCEEEIAREAISTMRFMIEQHTLIERSKMFDPYFLGKLSSVSG